MAKLLVYFRGYEEVGVDDEGKKWRRFILEKKGEGGQLEQLQVGGPFQEGVDDEAIKHYRNIFANMEQQLRAEA